MNVTKTISLEKYGINDTVEIIYNPSFDYLYNDYEWNQKRVSL